MLKILSFLSPFQWENHAKSLKLEEQTLKKIKDRIQEKVMNQSGTWIDWQYLLDAATLLKKVCKVHCGFLRCKLRITKHKSGFKLFRLPNVDVNVSFSADIPYSSPIRTPIIWKKDPENNWYDLFLLHLKSA